MEVEMVKQLMDENFRKTSDQCCFGCFSCNLHWRAEMSQFAKAKADQIQEKIDRYPPPGSITTPMQAAELKSGPTKFMHGLESREKLLQEIVDKLKDDQVDAVGIWGMGAIGKTTLAREVKNERAKDMFDEIVMVEVSKAPNIERIQTDIAEAIGLSLQNMQSLEARKNKLYTRLVTLIPKRKEGDEKSKRLLIILDNIWDEDELDLDKIRIPNPLGNEKKEVSFKILFTSRSKEACQRMGVKEENTFYVETLSTEDARYLFRKRRLGATMTIEDIEAYKSLEDKLLSKCGGIPLAIETLADTLKDSDLAKLKVFDDELEKLIISTQIDNIQRKIYPILKLSYKFISKKEKRRFFLLACLYPIGSSIPVHELLRYGVGLDLFQEVNSLIDAENLADKWVGELISSSLFLQDKSSKHVKIHDEVRASALSFAKEDKQEFMLEDIPNLNLEKKCKECTAISLMSGKGHGGLDGMECDNLQTLLLFGSVPSQFSDGFFSGMLSLKVLVVTDMNFEKGLPNSIKGLKNLMTLGLEKCILEDIGLIGELVNLLVLSVRESNVKELPESMKNLRNLHILDLNGCDELETFPPSIIRSLSKLEILYMFQSFKGWQMQAQNLEKSNKVSIEEMMDLQKLKVVELELETIEQWPIDHDGFLKNLTKFAISISGDGIDFRREGKYARLLEIQNCEVRSLSSCVSLMGLLRRSEYLKLYNISGMQNFVNDLDDNRGFTNLRHLVIKKCDDLSGIVNSNENMNDRLFSNLRELSLEELPKLKSYIFPVGVAQHLTKLFVRECGELKFVFFPQKLEEDDCIELLSLKSLTLGDLSNLESMLGSNSEESNQVLFHRKMKCPSLEQLYLSNLDQVKMLWDTRRETHIYNIANGNESQINSDVNPQRDFFRNLKTISIYGCHSMESLGPPSVLASLTNLESLEIQGCNGMTEIVTAEHHGKEFMVSFPKFRQINIWGLPSLKWLCGGSYQLLFPMLKELTIADVHEMRRFVEKGSTNLAAFFDEKVKFPCLEMLELGGINEEVEELWHVSSYDVKAESGTPNPMLSPVPHLKRLVYHRRIKKIPPVVSQGLSTLELYRIQNQKVLFSNNNIGRERFVLKCSQLPNLEEVTVCYCEELEELFEDDELAGLDNEAAATSSSLFCMQLKQLELSSLRKLRHMSNSQHMILLFKNLRYLSVQSLPKWKYVFSADMVATAHLELLEEIAVYSCKNMEAVIEECESKGHNSITLFPRLRIIRLFELEKALHFLSRPETTLLFPSLEQVYMYYCEEMESLMGGHNCCLSAPKLTTLWIKCCPKMQSFSTGTLNAPQLHRVLIDGKEYSTQEIGDINNFLRNRETSEASEEQEEGYDDINNEGEDQSKNIEMVRDFEDVNNDYLPQLSPHTQLHIPVEEGIEKDLNIGT